MRRRRCERSCTGGSIRNTWEKASFTNMDLRPGISIRNRTVEFLAATDAVRTFLSADWKQNNVESVAPTSKSKFTALAAQVGKDILQTSLKLSKLTKLAQRRSLFDDATAEIQELTYVITHDIGELNAKLDTLHKLRDSQKKNGNKQAGDHSESVVILLRGRLRYTAEGFKEVLKIRSDSLAAQRYRRSQFFGDTSNGVSFPASSAALNLGGGSLGADVKGASSEKRAEENPRLSLVRARSESTHQQARAGAVRQVESTVVELEQIFNQLATMVSEQGELVERIDGNVEDTVANIWAGHNQLIRYFNDIAGNRALTIKIFAVLIFFLILWTLLL